MSPEPRPAEPYPLEALGSLQGVIEDIAEAVGCDPGLAAQSVLMTAALATAGIANIILPKIGEVGLPLFFVTIARSSERKSSADRRAIRGVKDRVAELVGEHKIQSKRHRDEARIYAAAENRDPEGQETRPRTPRRAKLKALGPEPAAVAASGSRVGGHDRRGRDQGMGEEDLTPRPGPDDERRRAVRGGRSDVERHAAADSRHALHPLGLRDRLTRSGPATAC